jgi:hypothetical protein
MRLSFALVVVAVILALVLIRAGRASALPRPNVTEPVLGGAPPALIGAPAGSAWRHGSFCTGLPAEDVLKRVDHRLRCRLWWSVAVTRAAGDGVAPATQCDHDDDHPTGSEAMSVPSNVLHLERARGTGARCRLAWIGCLLAVSVVCVALVSPRPAVSAVDTSAAHPVVVAVWALADGTDPVSGGTVRVYPGARHGSGPSAGTAEVAPLTELDGTRGRRTASSGATVLEFAQLPAEFTVEVVGGSVHGRRLPGTLHALVRNYRSGTVVYVNPVTTLTEDAAARGARPVSPAAAALGKRRVYRLLRIPRWMDNADLSYSNKYFSGASYLASARRAGGIGSLDRALVRQAEHGRRPHRFLADHARTGARSAPHARAAVVSWAALSAGVLVKEVFKALALQAGKSLASVAGSKAATAALGWVLAAFGYGDLLKDQTMLEIRTAVTALGRQLTELQGDMALAGFSTLIHQTDRTIGQINHASSQLALLANLPDKDQTKPAFAQTIVNYIGANLIDAPEILNQNLGANLPIADNLIKSASRAVAQRSRFFDPTSSAQARSVYDYFAVYQAQLAMLLQEYYHAKPDVFSPTVAEANLRQLDQNVESQARSLKPGVPANTVIDTKTNQMWMQDLPTPTVNLNAFGEMYTKHGGRGAKAAFRLSKGAGPVSVHGVPFSNWEVPTMNDFQRLVEGRKGSSVFDWLRQEGRFSKRLLDGGSGIKWVRDGVEVLYGQFITVPLGIDRFNLAEGKPTSRFRAEIFMPTWRTGFDHQVAGLMYVRKVSASESYWWSG